jgi:hypothetical protein
MTSGVMRVTASRRVSASEIFRSKWRDMNPSRCLIRLRKSHDSASPVSDAAASGNRPTPSALRSAQSNRARSVSTRWPMLRLDAAAASTAAGSSVSTTAVAPASV